MFLPDLIRRHNDPADDFHLDFHQDGLHRIQDRQMCLRPVTHVCNSWQHLAMYVVTGD